MAIIKVLSGVKSEKEDTRAHEMSKPGGCSDKETNQKKIRKRSRTREKETSSPLNVGYRFGNTSKKGKRTAEGVTREGYQRRCVAKSGASGLPGHRR